LLPDTVHPDSYWCLLDSTYLLKSYWRLSDPSGCNNILRLSWLFVT